MFQQCISNIYNVFTNNSQNLLYTDFKTILTLASNAPRPAGLPGGLHHHQSGELSATRELDSGAFSGRSGLPAVAVLRHQWHRVSDPIQHHAPPRAAHLQERRRGHLHILLLTPGAAGARRGEQCMMGNGSRGVAVSLMLVFIHISIVTFFFFTFSCDFSVVW